MRTQCPYIPLLGRTYARLLFVLGASMLVTAAYARSGPVNVEVVQDPQRLAPLQPIVLGGKDLSGVPGYSAMNCLTRLFLPLLPGSLQHNVRAVKSIQLRADLRKEPHALFVGRLQSPAVVGPVRAGHCKEVEAIALSIAHEDFHFWGNGTAVNLRPHAGDDGLGVDDQNGAAGLRRDSFCFSL